MVEDSNDEVTNQEETVEQRPSKKPPRGPRNGPGGPGPGPPGGPGGLIG